jgi:preprotein translocase subunit Sec63
MKDDFQFMERITQDIEARKAACKVLGVGEDADKSELKKAYRKASMKYHPDHNKNDPDANKKFALVKCAYDLLSEDKPCPALLEEINSWSGFPEDEKYKLDNPWGHFLWWREKFFE